MGSFSHTEGSDERTSRHPKIQFCPYCGTKLDEDARFCKNCGSAVTQKQEKRENKTDNDILEENPTVRKTVYEGSLHKCPNCGEVLQAFVSVCPSCGYEIRDAKNSSAMQEFASFLKNSNSDIEKATIIRNYPIPNTKEDIYEFLVLAASNARTELSPDLINAWESKLEQVHRKCQLLFHDVSEYKQIDETYHDAIEKLNKQRKWDTVKKTTGRLAVLAPALPSAIIVFGWLFSLVLILPLCWSNLDNVGTNGHQLLFIVDLIAGAFFVPFTFKRGALLTRLLTTAGLALSIVLLIPLCGKNLDNVGTNAFQLLLIIDIVCSVIILIRMFKSQSYAHHGSKGEHGVSFAVTAICILILLITYGIGYIRAPKFEDHLSDITETETKDNDVQKIIWDDLILGKNLPDFGFDEAEIVWDTDNVLIMYFYDMTNQKYKSYIKECQDFGYNIDQENSGANFTAYNENGYYLHLQYLDFSDNKQLTIDLEDPIKKNAINWPDSKLVKDLPTPTQLVGEISTESDDAYAVYLTDIAPEYFDEYVSLCQENGFNVDYSKSDTYFSAENNHGVELTVEYKGFNILYIYISDYDW